MQVNGDFEGKISPMIVHCLGWCHIMTPVKPPNPSQLQRFDADLRAGVLRRVQDFSAQVMPGERCPSLTAASALRSIVPWVHLGGGGFVKKKNTPDSLGQRSNFHEHIFQVETTIFCCEFSVFQEIFATNFSQLSGLLMHYGSFRESRSYLTIKEVKIRSMIFFVRMK